MRNNSGRSIRDIHHNMTAIHQFAESLGNAIDAKDAYTEKHSLEVAEISRILALYLGLGTDHADMSHIAGHLHDIGKIGVPDCILNKQGRLDDAEWLAIRKHPASARWYCITMSVMTDRAIRTD